ELLAVLGGVGLYSQFNNAGEPQWLRVRRKAGDPLNLMRVMPPKGARVRCRTGIFSHASFYAWLFMNEQDNGAAVAGGVDPGPNESTETAVNGRGYNF